MTKPVSSCCAGSALPDSRTRLVRHDRLRDDASSWPPRSTVSACRPRRNAGLHSPVEIPAPVLQPVRLSHTRPAGLALAECQLDGETPRWDARFQGAWWHPGPVAMPSHTVSANTAAVPR